MTTEPTAVVQRLSRDLRDEFPGWRVGRGGSGRWWAVLGDRLVRADSAEELRRNLHALYAVIDEAGPRSLPPALSPPGP